MYVIYNRFTAVEQAHYDDWAAANAALLTLNAPADDNDPYALRLNA